ncbi:hypothetical protein [Pararhodobacter oceanensis]|uniref:hypothetical protein n=1 Tax=Pararhodobacter oceanensis TaxID=2172121 RepID=UPI003A952A11
MSFWDYVRAELKSAPLFLLVFLGIGVAMDTFVWQAPVNWIERGVVSLLVTVVFVLLTARRKKARSE